jgi:putative hydrolase of the HAD superfamily
MPGAAEVLKRLQGSVLIALVTNADDSDEPAIWKALHRVGLGSLFDRVFCSRAIGHRKPSIEFFKVILGELQVGPSVTVMVGDDFEVDVLGANAAGISAIWFNHRSAEKRSGPLHTTIHDLRDLPQALADLG